MIADRNLGFNAKAMQQLQSEHARLLSLQTAVLQKHGWIANLGDMGVDDLEKLLAQPSKREAM